MLICFASLRRLAAYLLVRLLLCTPGFLAGAGLTFLLLQAGASQGD